MFIDKRIKNPSPLFYFIILVMLIVFLFSRSEYRSKLYVEFNVHKVSAGEPGSANSENLASTQDEIGNLYANPLLDEPVQPKEPLLVSSNETGGKEENSIDASKNKVVGPRSISTINELMDHIKNDSLHTLDFDYLVDFINGSADAFQVLVKEYQYSDDSIRKSLLLQLIDNAHHPEKIDFAITLVQSNNDMERLKALRWLSHAPNQYDAHIVAIFADALDAQENDSMMLDVMDFLVIPSEESNPTVRARVMTRLSELVEHSDERVAEKALTRLASEFYFRSNATQFHSVESIVISKLSSDSEVIQLAAINALEKLSEPNEKSLEKLQDIMSNPYTSQQVRASAVRASVAIENKLNIRDLY